LPPLCWAGRPASAGPEFPATLGAALKMNQKNEKFTGDQKANELLARQPREPFAFRVA
jgi:hypothetical protein